MSGRVNSAWERFFFEPVSTATVAAVRIAFGLVMIAWTLSLLPALGPLLSDDGVVSFRPTADDGLWTLFDLEGGRTTVTLVWIVLLLASICLTLGLGSRVAAIVVFVGLISFQRRNTFAFAGGDLLLRTISFYLLFAPLGAALSLDRLRTARDRFWEFPQRAPWALRLIQIQLSVVYLSTVWDKVKGDTWNDGTAVSYALRIEDLARFPVPDFLADSLLLVNLLTYGTLIVELSIGILIWNRALRPYVIAAGVMLHLGIEYQLRVGWFLPAILTSYLAFAPPERVTAVVLALRDRLARSRVGRRVATAGSSP